MQRHRAFHTSSLHLQDHFYNPGHETIQTQITTKHWRLNYTFSGVSNDSGFQPADQRKDVSVPSSTLFVHLLPVPRSSQLAHRQAYLRVRRNIEVYHHIHMWDVQTSACNISSQQNRTCLCLELV